MKRFLFVASLVAVLAASSPPTGLADKVVLKSGQSVEGEVIGEDDTQVVVRVQVSQGVFDEKKFAKSEVERIDRPQPDDEEFKMLQNVVIGSNSFPLATYNAAVARLNAFLTKYPLSAHRADVGKRLAAFEEEKNQVTAGSVKLDGEWFTAEEVEKQRDRIVAQQLFNSMKEAAARGDYMASLNAFDELERKAAGSRPMPEAIELARRVAATVSADATRRLALLKKELADRQSGIALAAETEKQQMLYAIEQEKLQIDAALAANQKITTKWKPIIPRSDKSLEDTVRLTEAELKRLTALPIENMNESLRKVDEALADVNAGKLASAEPLLKTAQTLWPQNALIMKASAVLNEAKAEAAKATPTPKPASETSAPTPSQKAPATPVGGPGTADSQTGRPWYLSIRGAALGLAVIGGAYAVVSYLGRNKPKAE